MNTTSLLLIMMTIMILIASFLTFDGVQLGDQNSEREELRAEIAALKQESETLRLQAALQRAPIAVAPPAYPTPPVPPPTPADTTTPSESVSETHSNEIEQLKKQLQEEQEANQELQEENEKAKRKQDVAEKEASMAWRERTRAQQKAERERKRVEIALTMGTVTLVNTEYGFLTFKPAANQVFSQGQTLGIRRNSGILGQITIAREEAGQYIANIKQNAYAGGMPPIQEGDEVIVLPESYVNPANDSTESSPVGTGELRDLLPE